MRYLTESRQIIGDVHQGELSAAGKVKIQRRTARLREAISVGLGLGWESRLRDQAQARTHDGQPEADAPGWMLDLPATADPS